MPFRNVKIPARRDPGYASASRSQNAGALPTRALPYRDVTAASRPRSGLRSGVETMDDMRCAQPYGRTPCPAGRNSLRRGAVTLLEVLLAMGILVFLSSMTYWFYGSALGTRERDTQTSQKLQLVRVVLRRMADEIRQATRITADGRVGVRGEAERIWLSSTRVPSKDTAWFYGSGDALPPEEYDLVKIEYKVARHPDMIHEDGYPEAIGLARVEHRIPRPDSAESGEAFEDRGRSALDTDGQSDSGASESITDALLFEDEFGEPTIGVDDDIRWDELYARDIKFVRFCYFDGYRWWDDWDIVGENPLPQLVLITMGFEQRPPFDAKFGVRDREAEEFCTCMNRDPVDCLPLEPDQFSMTVRLAQADVFFRSRVNREMKSIIEEAGGKGTEAESGTAPGSGKSTSGKGTGVKPGTSTSGRGKEDTAGK